MLENLIENLIVVPILFLADKYYGTICFFRGHAWSREAAYGVEYEFCERCSKSQVHRRLKKGAENAENS